MNGAPLHVYRLGRVEYEDGLALQAAFGRARSEGVSPDVLLLLEHPPVLTMGRGAKRPNVLATDEQLAAQDVSLFETNRGGDVTYHGPGQIVGYPILQLPEGRRDVRRYVRELEETLIRSLARFDLRADRVTKWPGVWVGEEASNSLRKIAALGVHFSRWQTSHGFALNVNTFLEHFGLIIPCGIREAGVTSMQQELGRTLPLATVEDALIQNFSAVFDMVPEERAPSMHTVSVALTKGTRVLCLQRRPERGGFWQLVTGRIDAGESALDAATREVREETGFAGENLRDLSYRHSFAYGEALPPVWCVEQGFAAEAPVDFEPTLSDEHERFEWLTLDEAEARLPFAGLKRTARLALAADFSSSV